jgi:hypothetical protein
MLNCAHTHATTTIVFTAKPLRVTRCARDASTTRAGIETPSNEDRTTLPTAEMLESDSLGQKDRIVAIFLYHAAGATLRTSYVYHVQRQESLEKRKTPTTCDFIERLLG